LVYPKIPTILKKRKKMFFSSNSLYIFLLDINFENIIVGLHILIISFMLSKFQKDQKSINNYVINDMFKFQEFQ